MAFLGVLPGALGLGPHRRGVDFQHPRAARSRTLGKRTLDPCVLAPPPRACRPRPGRSRAPPGPARGRLRWTPGGRKRARPFEPNGAAVRGDLSAERHVCQRVHIHRVPSDCQECGLAQFHLLLFERLLRIASTYRCWARGRLGPDQPWTSLAFLTPFPGTRLNLRLRLLTSTSTHAGLDYPSPPAFTGPTIH